MMSAGLKGDAAAAVGAGHVCCVQYQAVTLTPTFCPPHSLRSDHMINIWGYSHISFMAPMSRFAVGGAGPAAAAREFKAMVKALHAQGVEVILDVVYNHTAESDDKDPYTLSFRWGTPGAA